MLERALTVLGHHEVMLAKDGQGGLNMAVLHRPEIVLLDISLPDMDGMEAVRQLHALGMAMPIVVVSGRVLPQEIALAMEAGTTHYFTKPIDVAALLKTIAAYQSDA